MIILTINLPPFYYSGDFLLFNAKMLALTLIPSTKKTSWPPFELYPGPGVKLFEVVKFLLCTYTLLANYFAKELNESYKSKTFFQ